MYIKIISMGIILLFVLSSMPTMFGYDIESKEEIVIEESSGPMNSPWPMKCHDTRHTGRSPYSTADNPGIEKWRFNAQKWVEGGIIIGDDDTIYFGSWDNYLYAVNPDGTEKWKYKTDDIIRGTPIIDENGTIYVGSWDSHLHAVNPDGAMKWKFKTDIAGAISSSPAIADDGTIYFGVMLIPNQVIALNPDGTEKWRFQTGDAIMSDPAIGNDGTIYIGSMDNYLYALYPNGTLRWRFKTGDDVKSPVSIADDGTIYFGSFDDHLYALYPNGTLKWKVHTVWGTSANPSIDEDGTIYVGTDKLYAISPDGTIKWIFDLGPYRSVGFSSPAISADGTIYFGTNINETDGGEIIAVNRDGTEKWRKKIADFVVDSSPCIGDDGTIYIGSSLDHSWDYLHAFGSVDSNEPPNKPTIGGTINGKAGKEYLYRFTSVDPDNNPVTFYIDWGDGMINNWDFDEASGATSYIKHTYHERGAYTIKAKARDTLGEESDWGELTVSMPRYKPTSLLYWFLEEHPRLFPILRRIIDM